MTRKKEKVESNKGEVFAVKDQQLIKPQSFRLRFVWLLLLALIFGFLGAFLAEWFLINYLLAPDSHSSFLTQLNLGKYFQPKGVVISKQENITVTQDQILTEVSQRVKNSLVAIFRQPTGQEGLESVLTNSDFLGLGLVVTTDGWLVTTDEVITEENDKVVINYQNEVLTAKAIHHDTFYHLVLIKVDPKQTGAVVKFAAAENINLGQLVFTPQLDSHRQLALTVSQLQTLNYFLETTGQPPLEAVEKLNHFYRLDSPQTIAGQPVFNLQGEVVGFWFNNWADEKQPVVLPSNQIAEYVNSGLSDEEVPHVYLGLHYLDLSSTLNLEQKLTQGLSRGALIIGNESADLKAVIKDSPAEKAGLKANDIITRVNKEEVNNLNSLGILIRSYKPGTEVKLTVLRAGEELVVPVVLGQQ